MIDFKTLNVEMSYKEILSGVNPVLMYLSIPTLPILCDLGNPKIQDYNHVDILISCLNIGQYESILLSFD